MALRQTKEERLEESPDIETEARMILSAVARMEGDWGAHKIAGVLCGSEARWLIDEGLNELSVYGLLDYLGRWRNDNWYVEGSTRPWSLHYPAGR